jgi:hypothetical protein
VRWIGIIGIALALVTSSAEAMDANSPCLGLQDNVIDKSPTHGTAPLLSGNQCEALKSKELRAPLLEIPQEAEDPVQLSLGIKSGGGMLRLKIPFSF